MCDDGDVPLFTEETIAAAADDNEEADTEAAVGAGFTPFTAMELAFHLISKAFRPECEARAAPERAPDRDCAEPGPESTVFGSSQQWRGTD
jgi:hypothetical protein